MNRSPEPNKLPRSPRRSLKEWGHFVHLLARFFMNYRKAILTASRRKFGRAVDIDVNPSKDDTMWAGHWAVVGKNKWHDPRGIIGSNARLDRLTDEQIRRLVGPNGERPYTILELLHLADKHSVRVEIELKARISQYVLKALYDDPIVQAMLKRGDIQIKTLAAIPGALHRLKPAHNVGFPTILSFTNYHGAPISKEEAWPVVDYTRGKPRWA